MSEPITDRLLLTKEQVKKVLGIGEAAFAELEIDFIKLGRRRRYIMADVMRAIEHKREGGKCRFGKGKIRRTGGTTSRSTVIGFEEALKHST